MANNYMHFSVALGSLTEEEKLWCANHFADCAKRASEDEDFEFEDDNVLFDYKFEEISGTPSLWMYTEESGSPGSVALFVRQFLEKWRPNDTFTICWATTCSKPRLNEFGGGTIYVTATEISECDGSCVLPSDSSEAPSYIQAAVIVCAPDGNFLSQYGVEDPHFEWSEDPRDAVVFDDEWQAREFMKEHGRTGWQLLSNPCTAIEEIIYTHE